MAINGCCPICGYRSTLVSFATNGQHAELQRIIDGLPDQVSWVANAYLEMFRPSSGHQLAGQKAIDLMTSLADLIATGQIIADGITRDCPPTVWARAIDFARCQPTVKRPLCNHNYLCRVAFGMAENASCGAVWAPLVSRKGGLNGTVTNTEDLIDAEFEKDGLLPLERQMKQQQR